MTLMSKLFCYFEDDVVDDDDDDDKILREFIFFLFKLCELSSYFAGYQMAPSVCQNLTGHNIDGGKTNAITATRTNCEAQIVNGSPKLVQATNIALTKKMTGDTSVPWQQHFTTKENQRPPVFNPEDYASSLKKYGKRQLGTNIKSIYETLDSAEKLQDSYNRYATLPAKCSEYKSPIPSPPETESEMTLRQFGSITDLLIKLRADLRQSFPSFVQEFVSPPLDGVSLLLEVLRAIQLSQSLNSQHHNSQQNPTASMPRNTQSYHRRALLDELACLQCLSICCCRSPEASSRLGSTPVGLLPLAASATGQGIRSRILALQLLTAACDRCSAAHQTQRTLLNGHAAVSEALSTLRLRCGEPVRFRLLIGMLNSGGGSGELQAYGVKFLNTFIESAENLQNRLYLQAELFQAGFDPNNMTKTISSTSPWLEKLRAEIRHFEEIRIDVDKLQSLARESERIRSQMVILERRVQILQEEKSVLTSMERRLQERCAELQRQVFRLQGVQNDTLRSLDKRPVALPRHVPPNSKQSSSEHEDEGISSSETGPSLSPVPILVLPQNNSLSIVLADGDEKFDSKENEISDSEKDPNSMRNINIEQLKYISTSKEQEIVPVNLLPQPPRKSRSLAHLLSNGGSDLDPSEYGMLLIQNNNRNMYFDDIEYDPEKSYQPHSDEESRDHMNHHNGHHNHHQLSQTINSSTNREILDVIMRARENEDDPTMNALRRAQTITPIQKSNSTTFIQSQQQQQQYYHHQYQTVNTSSSIVHSQHHLQLQNQQPSLPTLPPQQFNGVFFMAEMNRPQKYPKPDITNAIQTRRITKSLERIESCALDSMVDIVTNGPMEKSLNNPQIYFGTSPTLKIGSNSSNIIAGNNNNNCSNNCTNQMVKEQATTSRTKSHAGSKVTDIPSGLY
ncbi:uncharacterized protein LOC129606464 [Condylostylus longicornis]|uniref:uncharacterized protein LOC129606464 n=1 Tax=Condylostylus longicornis TaxID=2530218 RepID=UPI00244DF4E0|nr:uncharacterized protein LOC129606464 [Condylostylus longicornis]